MRLSICKKEILHSRKGFTILELAAIFIIVGIMVAIGMPYYERLIERSRTAEALQLIGTLRAAQERHMISKNRYTKYWHLLDATPPEIRSAERVDDFFNEDRTVFYTRGGLVTEEKPKVGYAMHFDEINKHWFIVADRVGRGKYSYSFVRSFDNTQTVCVPDMSDEDSVTLCTDFMGVESAEELMPDPRLAVQ